ncbi:secretory carrier-associated membrane protein 1-like isoform X1 [Glandiceps talaboti]
MSEFDSNPFADPEAGANPWQDPSVQQATAGGQRAGLDDFNPFADNAQTTKPSSGAKTTPVVPPPKKPDPSPAVMMPTEEPPAYTPTAAQPPPGQDDLMRRQEELERKAAELQRKENEMKSLNYNPRANNWPPLPEKCPVGPCFYQDFAVDIPLEFQRTVKMCYYLWMGYSCLLFLNMLGALACLCAGGDGCGTTFGISVVYLVLFTPCSFVCWYRPVYKAFRSDSSFNFFMFFFIFFCQICATILLAIGIPGWGSCGWIIAFTVIGDASGDAGQIVVGVIMLFIGVLFTVMAVLSAVMLKKVHSLYRTTGASFAKAQQEFATSVTSNPTVQETTRNAVTGAVTGAMTSGGGGTTSGNRM